MSESAVAVLHRSLGRLRLGAMLRALLEPKNVSEEQLLSWEQKAEMRRAHSKI